MLNENEVAYRRDSLRGRFADLEGRIVVYVKGKLLFSADSCKDLAWMMETEYRTLTEYSLAVAGNCQIMHMEVKANRATGPPRLQAVDDDFFAPPDVRTVSPYHIMLALGLGYEGE